MAGETDPKSRFTSRVENYTRYRPTYPRQVLEVLNHEIGLSPRWRVADLGSGTGISSKLFVEKGHELFAVEPNAAMRAAAEKLLGSYPNFHSVEGSAEATTLPDRSVELVVAAQAFHWFDPAATRTEALRILRPGGYAALLWNTRQIRGTPFLIEYERLLEHYSTDYHETRHDRVAPDKLRIFFGGDYRTMKLPNAQHLDLVGLRGRLLSSSYTPSPGHPQYGPMLRALDELFARHQRDDRITIGYETEIHWRRMS